MGFESSFVPVCLLAFYLISAPGAALEHALVRMSIIITNNELDDSQSLSLQSQTSRRKIKISIHLNAWHYVDNAQPQGMSS